MGYYQKKQWLSSGSGQRRIERKSGSYYAYIPTRLATLTIQHDSDVIADIVSAEKALQLVETRENISKDIDGLSRFLLRAEAISSSFIEGLQLGAKRLMKAELNTIEPNTFKPDETASEIVGNILALRDATNLALGRQPLQLDDILKIHRVLLERTPQKEYAGKIRTMQNWIGGNSYNPFSAAHVPPPPEYVPELLEDLLAYCNRTDISPLQQAAMVHAQFETIHPFVDGNGRTGRALIPLILKRRDLLTAFVPPISLVLATHTKSYIEGLNSFRFEGEQPDAQSSELINDWLSFFSVACIRACNEVEQFSKTAYELRQRWKEHLGSVRKNSSLDLLLNKLIGMPVFTVNTAAQALERSFQATNDAIERLIKAGIVKPLNAAQRNRAFEVPEALDIFRQFERQLASPAGNTALEKPVRPVPYRN